jgi:hypothetical protein
LAEDASCLLTTGEQISDLQVAPRWGILGDKKGAVDRRGSRSEGRMP